MSKPTIRTTQKRDRFMQKLLANNKLINWQLKLVFFFFFLSVFFCIVFRLPKMVDKPKKKEEKNHKRNLCGDNGIIGLLCPNRVFSSSNSHFLSIVYNKRKIQGPLSGYKSSKKLADVFIIFGTLFFPNPSSSPIQYWNGNK